MVSPPPFQITNKEKATLKDICEGLTNKEIGDKHHITEKAAEKKVYNLFVKTKTKKRAQLIVYTLRNDLIVDMEM